MGENSKCLPTGKNNKTAFLTSFPSPDRYRHGYISPSFVIKNEHNSHLPGHIIQHTRILHDKMDAVMNDPNLADFPLDIFGQQSRINRLYTQITFCYPLAGDDSNVASEIIKTLEKGFRRISESFPWISGKIANENGSFKIKRGSGSPHIVIKNFTKDPSVPDWDSLQQASFPFSMIDGSVLAPCRTLESSSEGLLVFLIQVNFVRGRGLLLTLNGQHGAMDMAGLAQVMYLFSKACRNEAFTEDELSIGNMDRRNVIPLVDDEMYDNSIIDNNPPIANEKFQQVQQKQTQASSNSCTWAYISFSGEKLATLKAHATATLPSEPSKFISTDDALSAFVWGSISRIRLQRYVQCSDNTRKPTTTLSRNVDVRCHLGIPATYPGLVTDQTAHTFPLEEVANQSLGFLSSELRSALDPASLSRHTREIAARISRQKNLENAMNVSKSYPEFEVRLSSWAKERCCALDFGFGLPVAVRRPRFTDGSRDGLVYFLPKSLDGEIVVGVCLGREDMDLLRNDEEFIRFGTFLG